MTALMLVPRIVAAQGFDQPLNPGQLIAAAIMPLPPTSQGPVEAVTLGRPVGGTAVFTLADLEGIALANNPSLVTAKASIQAAKGEWLQVGLLPNPTAGYSAAEIGDNGRAGQQGGVVGQEIVLGHKLKLNRAVAAQDIRRAEQELDAQRLRVLNDVRIQFYAVLIAQEKVQLAEKLVSIGQQGTDAAQNLYKAQEVGMADVLQARIEANTARIMAENAHNGHLAAWRILAAALGMPDLAMTPLSGDIHAGLPNIEWGDALQKILSGSPELAAAQANVERARWAIDRARAEPIPNIDLQVTGQHDNATSDNIVGVQAVLPIPIWNRNQGGISKAEAEFAAAKSDVLRMQLRLQQRLAVAYERYANALQQVERYEKDILPDAQSSLDLVNVGYKQSEFSYLNLLTAQRTYFQTNLAYLDAMLQLRESSVEIDGLLLRGSLQQGE
jgi:cobalt-zinc-cadmium efflux system outer membrane protein